MGRRMNRGKQQILLNYLPGKTFDFEKVSVIARVDHIRGVPRTDLSVRLILQAVDEQAQAWPEQDRSIFRDMERSADRFVLIDPQAVEASMFPLVFWCQNPLCGVVVEPKDGPPPSRTCRHCGSQRLVQLRFVRVHHCGALEPLTAPECKRCKTNQRMALDTRGSERVSDFQWVCRACGWTTSVFGGRCRCNWSPSGDPSLKNMSVEVHRAGRTFYPHYAVLLNQPGRELSAFLEISHWQAIAAAKFLNLPEVEGRRLVDYVQAGSGARSASNSPFSLTEAERTRLRSQGISEEMIAQFERMQAELQASRNEAEAAGSPDRLAEVLVQRSGVSWEMWERAGQEMLEAVMPLESGTTTELFDSQREEDDDLRRAKEAARRLGLQSVTLVIDFPVTTATFGYTRSDYQPGACRLNPFPPDRDHGGRFPIFVDTVQADAIMLRLDHGKVLQWMRENGFSPQIPHGKDSSISARAYFVKLFDRQPLRHSIQNPELRLVFGLLHTLSHLAIKRAALLCGLEMTSLSEYVLPGTLSCALYCNHRFGATIGALSALFEQSLAEWLAELRSNRRCVYDPVCIGGGGSCHACTHLAETSCRFFNLNLGRSFLFGGHDPVVGEIQIGFFDFVGRT